MAETTQTVLDALRAVNPYPIPMRTIEGTAAMRSLDVDAEATEEILSGSNFRLAMADLLWWLAFAPDVSQGGQNYSFTDAQRDQLRRRAQQLWDELDDSEADSTGLYGYKGTRL
ncbi:MAG: hypothetical protein LUC24_04620 [Bacteroidales bacterium]|nr:hypothetical protein [Bacteroidales bacterium]